MATQNPTIALAAGGTGGHLFPAQALAEQLQRHYHPILLTDTRGAAILSKQAAPLEHYIVDAASPSGSLSKKISASFHLIRGFFQARKTLKRQQASFIVGFGGYPSFPTIIAARWLKIPIMLHEQNAVLGRVNRAAARFASSIATTFEHTAYLPSHIPHHVVGNPVKADFIPPRSTPYQAPTQEQPFRLIILGGSQGSHFFSSVIPSAITLLPKSIKQRLHITQQCRQDDIDHVNQTYSALPITYDLAPFFTNIAEHLTNNHLLIARSGASTIAELTAIGIPALLIPYLYAMDDHQTTNAKTLEEKNACVLLPQQHCNPKALSQQIEALITTPNTLKALAANASQLAKKDAAITLAKQMREKIQAPKT